MIILKTGDIWDNLNDLDVIEYLFVILFGFYNNFMRKFFYVIGVEIRVWVK